ncbi:hypothetical protein [Shinella sp.]|uniref:RapZ C-terminal domain-containing protein n=1 Tax=Shinella sp. TaxID=1870904 RepID=UPI0039E2D0E8
MTTLIIKSFGIKNGPGPKAYDCMRLPNPYNTDMRRKTGLELEVQVYVAKNEMAMGILARAEVELLREGAVHFACYGGKHRSVAMAEVLGRRMRPKGHKVEIEHRDLPPR